MTQLLADGAPALRYTPQPDLFNHRVILVPIHMAVVHHWVLIVIKPADCSISFYDSLGGQGRTLTYAMNKYLDHVSLALKLPVRTWQIDVVANLPKQTNGVDCGVFCCYYARCVVSQSPIQPFNAAAFRSKILAEIRSGVLDDEG